MLLLRFVGPLLLRFAARMLVALLFQLPPRLTRLAHRAPCLAVTLCLWYSLSSHLEPTTPATDRAKDSMTTTKLRESVHPR